MARKSTIVPKLTLATLIAALATLQRVSPRAASALAEKLWFYAGAPPAAAVRNRRGTPEGQSFSLAHGSSMITGRRWGDASAPTAYLVHGWGGWWQQLGAFVPLLTDLGYHVVAFDALGHGDSSRGALGRRSTHVPELAESFATVVSAFGAPRVTVAHSIGCVSVGWAQRSGQAEVGDRVLIAPAVSTGTMVETFARRLRIGDRTRERLVSRIEARVGRRLEEFDLTPPPSAGQGADRVLIVHDRDDDTTDLAESAALVERWPGAELLVTQSLGHYKVLRAEPTLSAVAGFLGAVPSAVGVAAASAAGAAARSAAGAARA